MITFVLKATNYKTGANCINTADKIMNTFTARVTKEGQSAKFIANAVILKGFLASYANGRYKLYYNSSVIEKVGLTKDFVKDFDKKGADAVLAHELLPKCLFKMGENEGGFLIENYDEVKLSQEAERKELIDKGQYAVSLGQGIFGFTINERLSAQTWAKIKAHATYHNGDEADIEWAEDMGYYDASKYDLKGWFYSSEVIETLNAMGIGTKYCDVIVRSAEDIFAIDKENERIRAEKREAERKAETERKEIERKERDRAEAEYRALLEKETTGLVGTTVLGDKALINRDENSFCGVPFARSFEVANWSTHNGSLNVYENENEKYVIEYYGNAQRVFANSETVLSWSKEAINKSVSKPSTYLIETILHFRGGKFTDFSGCYASQHYQAIANDPQLSETTINNYKQLHTNTELTEQDIEYRYSIRNYFVNGEEKIFAELGILDEVVAARQEKRNKLADMEFEDLVNKLSFNLIDYFIFNEIPTEIENSESLLMLAIKRAYKFEDKWENGKEKWVSLLKDKSLKKAISDKEIDKNTTSKYKGVFLEFEANTISIFRKALIELGIHSQAIEAYNTRFIEAMKINPHFTQTDIDLFVKKINRTREQIKFDNLLERHKEDGLLENAAELIFEKELVSEDKDKAWKGLTELHLKLKDGTTKTLYECNFGWSSYDDASNDYYLYEDKEIALKYYNDY